MRTAQFEVADVLKAFKTKKVLTKEELLEEAGCSAMTAWRLLREHGYWTSYNDNARHYTLEGIPRFDEHGLWKHGRVRFSKWGSLTKSIVGLVDESSAGLTAEELEGLLQIKNVKPSLTRLVKTQALRREKMDGRFVYFSLQRAARDRQQREREDQAQRVGARRELPPLEDIIALLVEMIRRPKNSPRQWARGLTREGIRMGTGEIEAVIKHYRIDIKKGRLRS